MYFFLSLPFSHRFTNSRPLDSKVWDKNTKRTKSSLKSFVRSGVELEVRRKYWLAMMQIVDEDVILYSKAIGQPDDSKKSNNNNNDDDDDDDDDTWYLYISLIIINYRFVPSSPCSKGPY